MTFYDLVEDVRRDPQFGVGFVLMLCSLAALLYAVKGLNGAIDRYRDWRGYKQEFVIDPVTGQIDVRWVPESSSSDATEGDSQ